MTKQTKKQIKAELINEVSASYRSRIKALEERVKYLSEEIQRKTTELYEFKKRALTAEDELEQYADWNRRLQEFMDMSPGEREKAFQTLEVKTKLAECVDSYGYLFKYLGIHF